MLTDDNRTYFFNMFVPHQWHTLGYQPPQPMLVGGSRYYQALATFQNYLKANPSPNPLRAIRRTVTNDDKWRKFFSNRCAADIVHYYNQKLDDRTYESEHTPEGWCLGAVSSWLHRRARNKDVFPIEFYYANAACANVATKIMQFQNYLLKHLDNMPRHIQLAGGAKPALDYIYGRPGVGRAAYRPLLLEDNDISQRFNNLPQTINQFGRQIQNPLLLVSINFHEYIFGGAHALGIDRSTGEIFDPNLGVIKVRSGTSLDICNFLLNNIFNQYYVHNAPPGMLTREPYNGNIALLRIFNVITNLIK